MSVVEAALRAYVTGLAPDLELPPDATEHTAREPAETGEPTDIDDEPPPF